MTIRPGKFRLLFTMWSLPERVDNADEFSDLPMDVQGEVLHDWVYCRNNGRIHGEGLVQHYNWVMFEWLEEEWLQDQPRRIPGVTFNGEPITEDWVA